MKRHIFSQILHILFILGIFIFSAIIINTIKQYVGFKTDIGFLKFKQDVIGNKYWMFCFYVHIASITFSLLAGLTQFSNTLLHQYPRLHRAVGKIYVYNILLINVPVCFMLSIFSNGGLIGILGFLVQNFFWAYFTIVGILSVKKRQIKKHQNFMILSYAITTTALTFRIIKNLFYREDQFEYHFFYGITVWLALIINLTIATIVLKNRVTTVQ